MFKFESSEADALTSFIFSDNIQEYAFSTFYTHYIQSYIEETTPNVECENASNKRNTGTPESSEAFLAKEPIPDNNEIYKRSSTGTYDISNDNTCDILVNQLHKTIVEMRKCENEGFKREYCVSRHMV